MWPCRFLLAQLGLFLYAQTMDVIAATRENNWMINASKWSRSSSLPFALTHTWNHFSTCHRSSNLELQVPLQHNIVKVVIAKVNNLWRKCKKLAWETEKLKKKEKSLLFNEGQSHKRREKGRMAVAKRKKISMVGIDESHIKYYIL